MIKLNERDKRKQNLAQDQSSISEQSFISHYSFFTVFHSVSSTVMQSMVTVLGVVSPYYFRNCVLQSNRTWRPLFPVPIGGEQFWCQLLYLLRQNEQLLFGVKGSQILIEL